MRELVALVFTDIVGSTRTTHTLGDRVWNDVRRRHFDLTAKIAQRHGGTVVKNLGDGLMLSFRGASGAVAAAGEIQRAVHAGGGDPEALRLRVGVHAGEALHEGDDWFGATVIVAQRLCAAAQGGQVLVSEIAVSLVDGDEHVTEAVGPLELKGVPDPVDAVELIWDRPLARVPLPPVLGSAASEPLVGREHELERIKQLWADACSGELRVVVLAGEPGIGKTHLAAHVGSTVTASGAAPMFGRCDPDVTNPYGPVVTALRQLLDQLDPSERAGVVEDVGDDVVAALEGRQGVTELDGAGVERHRLFEGVARLLRQIAARRPLYFVVDDLQWVDQASAALLRHVLLSPEQPGMLFVATWRQEATESAAVRDLVAQLQRACEVERLELTGLDAAETEELLARTIPGDRPGAQLVERLRSDTNGNPLFLVSTIRHLDPYTGAPGSLDTIPASVQDAIGVRLRNLSERSRRHLRTAAVLGSEFALDVVAEMEGCGLLDVVDSLDEAVGARLADDLGGSPPLAAFSHGVVRDVLYAQLNPTRRALLHGSAARVMEGLRQDSPESYAAELAHHFQQAGDAPRKVVEHAVVAASSAAAAYAYDDACQHVRHAIAALTTSGGSTEHMIDLLIRHAEYSYGAGDDAGTATSALRAAALSREIADAPRLAASASAYRSHGRIDLDAPRALFTEALEALDEGQHELRVRLLREWGMLLQSHEHYREAEQAYRAAQAEAGDASAVTRARVLLSLAPYEPDPGQREDDVRLAQTLGAGLLDAGEIVQAHAVLASCHLERGDRPAARAALEQLRGLSERVGRAPLALWDLKVAEAMDALLDGHLHAAEAHATDALAVSETLGDGYFLDIFGAQLFVIRWDQGRIGELEELAAAQVAEVPSWEPALAAIWCETGRSRQASTSLEAVLDRGLDDLADWLRPVLVGLMAHVAHDLGDAGLAARIDPLLRAHSGQALVGRERLVISLGAADAYLARCASVMGDLDLADHLFGTAARFNSDLEAPLALARTLADHASTLRRRGRAGDSERADELVSAASACLVGTTGSEGVAARIQRAATGAADV